jgi:hypothetical protein
MGCEIVALPHWMALVESPPAVWMEGVPLVRDTQVTWRPLPPPKAGTYMVSCYVDIHDDGIAKRFVRMDYFDGKSWPRCGAYAVYEAWATVEPWDGETPLV